MLFKVCLGELSAHFFFFFFFWLKKIISLGELVRLEEFVWCVYEM